MVLVDHYSDSISVTLTKAAEAIAQNNQISRGFFDDENNDNQTDDLRQINRGGSVLNQLYSSLWLGRKHDSKTFSLDEYDPDMDMKRLMALLADDDEEGDSNA